MKNMSHEDLLAYAEAARRLDEWADENTQLQAERDVRIKEAHAAGLPNTEIAKRLGIGRGTVIAVIGPQTGLKEG
jgi:DNA-binding NarL/FixJ family response regulator